MPSTTRLGIPYPILSDTADAPRDFEALADALDNAAIDAQGTLGSRPSAGLRGRFYWSTDSDEKMLYRDDGATWFNLNRIPDGNAASPGLVFAKDLNTGIYRPAADSLSIATAGVGRTTWGAGGDISHSADLVLINPAKVFSSPYMTTLDFSQMFANAKLASDAGNRMELYPTGIWFGDGTGSTTDGMDRNAGTGVLEFYAGNAVRMNITPSGVTDASNLIYGGHRALLTGASSAGITVNVATPVLMATEVVVSDGLFHNSGNANITVLESYVAGWYLVTGFAIFNGAAGGTRWAYITKNDVNTQLGGQSGPADAAGVSLTATALVHLDVGDYVKLYVLHTSVNTVALTGGWLSAVYVGH